MLQFPSLKTGAVVQYPGGFVTGFVTQAVRFLDGSSQRFRLRAAPKRRWLVRLNDLDDAEMARLDEFLAALAQTASGFRFVDPWDGTEYVDCRLEGGSPEVEWTGYGRGRSNLVIRES